MVPIRSPDLVPIKQYKYRVITKFLKYLGNSLSIALVSFIRNIILRGSWASKESVAQES